MRKRLPGPHGISAGQDARLYGRQDACRYGKQVLSPRRGRSTQSPWEFSRSISICPNRRGRDDFAERGSVSRSTLKATEALDLSKRWAAGKAPASHRPALLWLRLGRAAWCGAVS